MLPRTAARLELARAIGGGLVAPLRFLAHLPARARVRREIAADVAAGAGIPGEIPDFEIRKDRPLRIFLSAAEASGEIHGASLAKALWKAAEDRSAPRPEIIAVGGERLRALGITTIGDPVARAETGFDGVLQSLPYYVGLLEDAARHARETRPDVVVPIDSPALHVPLARMVRRYGSPVVHVVAPQYWGWAPWRVGAYRKVVDRALTILPHEPAWFGRHDVATAHIGHPLLDALAGVPVTEPDPASRVLALLPGSRRGVIRRNLPWMITALGALRAEHPDAEIRILQSTPEHRELIEGILAETQGGDRARLVVGDLHGNLTEARAAFAVSGTILTDVLHHRLPTVVVYRVSKRLETWMYRNVLTCPYFASTNLLAGAEVLPEHCFRGHGPMETVSKEVAAAFGDEARRAAYGAGIAEAARRLGSAGAIERAAGHVLQVASRGRIA
ncbi:Glycosyl transferase [Planctomycetes bacterium Poly30]|uniref:Lipid-A-disaccharide synthase n=2 Tax=Saltatorellus ferox TaxID=2528018 RepID=A0A518EV58_9BACT|nr:Glycosyl transferase [Planctomycetes bacterium Poly30]